MSDLRQALDDYLAVRRALGFQLRGYDRFLGDLVSDLERAQARAVTTELAVAWATKPTGVHLFRYKSRLSIARGFARYMQTIDADTQVPPSNLLAFRPRARPAPYLYSAAEIDALLQATDTLRPVLRAATYRTLLGLLAVTGMRVGEAIALDRNDVDLRERRLVIREAKTATRQLPLHPSSAQELDAYARRRDQLCRAPKTPSFLVSTAGTRPIYECVRETFLKLRATAGLDRDRPGPRIHDLRHTFAVQTLLEWHRADVDVAARLPLLSAWLGHRHPASTYYYLQAAPELLALAAQRLPDLGART
ncbi:MAG: tyrosine-type recombinase/integrase [Solirubrobacteraceae bacterium]